MPEIVTPLFKEIDEKIQELYNQRKRKEGLICVRNSILSKVRSKLKLIEHDELELIKRIEANRSTQIDNGKK